MASQQITAGKMLSAEERKILILYGSETGNSHDFSIDLETMAERLRFRADVFAIDAITLVSEPSQFAGSYSRLSKPRNCP